MAATAEQSARLGLYGPLSRLFKARPTRVREAVWGVTFISPWILGLIIFTIGPLAASFYWSFTEFDILGSPKWIGLDNFITALNLNKVIPLWPDLRPDRLFYHALGRTLVYAGLTVPIGTISSLLLAILLNQGLKGTYIYRTLFFIPHLVPSVAYVMLWKFLMHPRVGLINSALAAIGIQGPGWLTHPDSAMMSVVLIGLWGSIGGNRMLIFLAGLQGVPQELYEAADLDGANSWHKFWNVTFPMISPTVLFNLLLGIIGALQVFNIAFLGTGGGPSYATWFYALHIYRQAFEYFRMGYGSALAWMFAIALVIFTLIQMRLSERWVYYAGGS
ncbi:MAG: sugar ABC transporter permease [Chloroflexi bacterium]|nr:sugar ABC transporter permease [Chloroflexota bacterium]